MKTWPQNKKGKIQAGEDTSPGCTGTAQPFLVQASWMLPSLKLHNDIYSHLLIQIKYPLVPLEAHQCLWKEQLLGLEGSTPGSQGLPPGSP